MSQPQDQDKASKPKKKRDTPKMKAFRAQLAASRQAQRDNRVAGQLKLARRPLP